MTQARYIQVRGIVQGVGFRPFVFGLAQEYGLKGWVLNQESGVQIHVEGLPESLEHFLQALSNQAPAAAKIAGIQSQSISPQNFTHFEILPSQRTGRPTVLISPDLAVCEDCLIELFDPSNRRYHYPYINCTHCGPRYSVILDLPYDRPNTTMRQWPMCPACQREYHDPLDRRFHAQPTACPVCGPGYYLVEGRASRAQGGKQQAAENQRVGALEQALGIASREDAIAQTVQYLLEGKIVAIKGIGGYHLACDAMNPQAVQTLRQRKFRKEKPFALMADSLETARTLIKSDHQTEELLTSVMRPIVLAAGKGILEGVAPGNADLGLMLPYTPVHHLLFAAGAPKVLVLTSANRSSEPIAYQEDEALTQLAEIADAFLIGQRPIARRVDDSVVRSTPFGPQILRRARGYAPSSLTPLATKQPILAVGADLKNSLTLAVNGEALVGQHLGDLHHLGALLAFQETAADLLRMYELQIPQLYIAHDLHPQYQSTQWAQAQAAKAHHAVQHHQAHIASVLAEHGLWEVRVLGIAWDGTGYGEDGAIWGGEAFVGSLQTGFTRAAHLHYAALVGGDAAAGHPVQAAAGFLQNFAVDFTAAPFNFPPRFSQARQILQKNLRVFPTSSMGRLFDCVAALLGFTQAQSFEGQAAVWLEHQARQSSRRQAFPFPLKDGLWLYHPLLEAVIAQRQAGKPVAEVARGFILGLARGLLQACRELCETHQLHTIALSGGVFQNRLLLEEIHRHAGNLQFLVNQKVPPNDGGISLGQAALLAAKI